MEASRAKVRLARVVLAVIACATSGPVAACRRSGVTETESTSGVRPNASASAQPESLREVSPRAVTRPVAESAPSATARAPVVRDLTVAGLSMLELAPPDVAEHEALPLLVFMHGAGGRPQSFVEAFASFPARVRIVLPQGPMPMGKGYLWFSYPADGPTLTRGLESAALMVSRSVEALRKESTPPRIIVGGFSQGAMLSFALAAQRPDLFRAAVPIAGLLPTGFPLPSAGGHRPKIWAYHGDVDHLVPLARAKETVEALRAGGYSAELEVYPGVGHAIPQEMRAAVEAKLVHLLAEP